MTTPGPRVSSVLTSQAVSGRCLKGHQRLGLDGEEQSAGPGGSSALLYSPTHPARAVLLSFALSFGVLPNHQWKKAVPLGMF